MKTIPTYKKLNSIAVTLLLAAVALFIPTANAQAPAAKAKPTQAVAILASGCFWGTQYMFREIKGVKSTTVGYCGGFVEKPTYKQVCTGKTGHAESMKIVYDPSQVSYETLARQFFNTHDPSQVNRQGPDIGTQYRSAIFYTSEDQKAVATKLVGELKAKGINVATEITPATTFWPAEDYHQKYYEKNGHKPYCHKFKELF